MPETRYKRGGYPRGHSIRCKYCGHLWEEHDAPTPVRNPTKVRKSFRVSFSACMRKGYAPADVKKWKRRERAFQKREREDFVMACYEQQARASSAWSAYGARVRTQNYHRTLSELQEQAAHAYGFERPKAEEKLGSFLKKAKGSTILVIGGGGPYLSDE